MRFIYTDYRRKEIAAISYGWVKGKRVLVRMRTESQQRGSQRHGMHTARAVHTEMLERVRQ